MKLPADVARRQEELRRAAKLRAEAGPPPERELTLADDCAAVLEGWFMASRAKGRDWAVLTSEDMDELRRKMRALSMLSGVKP